MQYEFINVPNVDLEKLSNTCMCQNINDLSSQVNLLNKKANDYAYNPTDNGREAPVPLKFINEWCIDRPTIPYKPFAFQQNDWKMFQLTKDELCPMKG
jgi:hypothetical protein